MTKTTPSRRSAPTKSKSSAKKKAQTKYQKILALLRRKDGASLEEIQKASGWQAHSVRGFLSGYVKKKAALKLQSSVGKDGVRRYAVVV